MADSDDRDFETQFAELYPKVLAFALRRTPDRPTAEDIAAETFAIAWRRRDEQIRDRLLWLYGVAHGVIRNHRRSVVRRDRLHSRIAFERAGEGPDPSRVVTDRAATLEAFSRLDEADRELLMLIAWEGVSSREGALILGCTRSAFELRLYRARRRLEKELRAAGHSLGRPPRPHPNPASEER